MMNILKIFGLKNNKDNLKNVAKKQLSKNIKIIKSLEDYDNGKKNIPTNNIRKYLPDIRIVNK